MKDRTMAGATRLFLTTLVGLLVGLLVAGGASCAPAVRAYRAPGPAIPPAATVAMVPLTNLTSVENAARLMTDQLVLEIGRLRLFQVQEPGVVLGALRKLRILTPDRISAEQMKSLAETVGTPFLLTGTVTQCVAGGEFVGQYPAAAVSLRLVDARDGYVLWAATQARAGNDRETVFGLGRVHTLEELSNQMARDLVRSMRDLTRPGRPLRNPRPVEPSS
jgi:TolB-like protein